VAASPRSSHSLSAFSLTSTTPIAAIYPRRSCSRSLQIPNAVPAAKMLKTIFPLLLNHHIPRGSTADLLELSRLVSDTLADVNFWSSLLTWICHWDLSSWHNAESTLDGWCADKHDRSNCTDDDRKEDCGLFMGGPAHVFDWRAPEVRRDHDNRVGFICLGYGGMERQCRRLEDWGLSLQ